MNSPARRLAKLSAWLVVLLVPAVKTSPGHAATDTAPHAASDTASHAASHAAHAAARGHAPDLATGRVDTSQVKGDWQKLVVTGTVTVEIRNVGDLDVDGDFQVALFLDADLNSEFDQAHDVVLATRSVDSLPRLGSTVLRVPVTTAVSFRDQPISAYVDVSKAVDEFREDNNYGASSLDCRVADAPAPDLSASYIRVRPTADPGVQQVLVRIGNAGAVRAGSGAVVELLTDSTGGMSATSRELRPGEFDDVSILWERSVYRGRVYTRVLAPGDCDSSNNEHGVDVVLLGHPGTGRTLYIPRAAAFERF